MSKIGNAVAFIVSMAGVSMVAEAAGPSPKADAGSLSQALRDYGEQRHQTLIYTEDLVAGIETPAAKAGPAPELKDLLAGTGLVAERSPSGAWMIRRPILLASADSPTPAAGRMRLAQAAPAAASTGVPPSAASEPAVDEIVVTGSRIARDGFSAPTPTTVVSAVELQQRGANNIIDAINEIPAFRPSQTPAAAGRGGGVGGSFLDLRGLNGQGGTAVARTLVLVDGRRFVTTNSRGQVDIALIPNSLVERSEVVTGGASAAWGSDAVAGVVNLILKDRLQGVETSLSYGQSAESDYKERAFSIAAGSAFAGDRGHVIFGAEYVDNEGVPDGFLSRDWGKLAYGEVTLAANRAAGLPSRLVTQDVRISDVMTPGGIIIAAPGTPVFAAGLDNIQFLGGQATSLFVPGSIVGGTQMVGGGPDSNVGIYNTGGSFLVNPVERMSALGRVNFDLTDSTSAFLEVSHGGSKFFGYSASRRDNPAALVIARNNAYLPTAIAARIPVGVASINVGRIAYDSNFGNYTIRSDQKTDRIVAGFKGALGGDWKWDAYAEWGQNKIDDVRQGTLVANYLAAVNAINVGGTIVCNPAGLTNSAGTADPGCVPFNWAGRNSPSDAAVNYVRGTSLNFQTSEQRAAALNFNGSLFSLWAGPVSLAAGLEYRREFSKAEVNSDNLNRRFDLNNFQPLDGSYDTKEVYLETVVPLLKDLPLARSLELNAAARRTDYSTSGAVTTWKVGVGYEPFADLRLRATQSRDIRAPNINELFSPSSAVARQNVLNIFNGGAGIMVDVITLGNPDLTPEVAETFTAGVLYQPSWVPGLRFSADYYDIKINDVIATLAADQTVLRCQAGNTALCANLDLDAARNIIRVRSRQQNFSLLETDGLDFEMGYNLPGDLVIPGQISLRAFGTFVNEFRVVGAVTDIDEVKQRVPKWSANFNLGYSLARFSAQAQVRFVGKTVFNTTYIGPEDPGYSPVLSNSINFNERKKVFYTNLSGQYRLVERDSTNVQVFAVVNNVFDRDPPPFAGNNPIGASLYDLVGRAYKLGVRVSF